MDIEHESRCTRLSQEVLGVEDRGHGLKVWLYKNTLGALNAPKPPRRGPPLESRNLEANNSKRENPTPQDTDGAESPKMVWLCLGPESRPPGLRSGRPSSVPPLRRCEAERVGTMLKAALSLAASD